MRIIAAPAGTEKIAQMRVIKKYSELSRSGQRAISAATEDAAIAMPDTAASTPAA